MIRLIFVEVDAADTAAIGSPVKVMHKSFDLDLPKIEAWLNEPKNEGWSYCSRQFVGIEILPGEKGGSE